MSDIIFVKDAEVLLDGCFTKTNLLLKDGVIADISPSLNPPGSVRVLQAHGLFALPGFIDIHMHGAVGVDITDTDHAGLTAIAEFIASQGTTSWIASLLAETEEDTNQTIDMIITYMRSNPSGARLLGIHLEGPFINGAYKGAMSEHLLREGNLALFERFRKRAEGNVRYITLAPEVTGVEEMILPIAQTGIKVSMGHTDADYDLSMRSFQNGVTSITHIFNGMRLFHQHEPAVMGAALESDVYCEMICDGFHLHPGTVRMLLKSKGYDKVIAVTDSNMAAGMPDGVYKLGGKDIVVKNGDAKLANTGMRSASTLTMLKALHNLQTFTGQPINELSPLLSANPAAFLGIESKKGYILKGFDADIVLLDKKFDVAATIVEGCLVYQKY